MTVGVPLPDAPAALADRRVFAADGVVFTVADLARLARVGGRGTPFAAATPEGVEELFRRSRGLLRAEQLESWLGAWEIAADDFRRWTQDTALGTSTATSWCSLVCSGDFDASVSEVAGALAAACELGAGPASAAEFDPADWAERIVSETTTAESLTEVIDANRLDWTRLEIVRVETTRRAVAEELRHQLRSDGTDLRTAAVGNGLLVQEVTDVLATFGSNLRSALAGARAGDVVGPLPTGSNWTLISVLDRTAPTLADPGTRARAQATLRHAVIARAVARHVVA